MAVRTEIITVDGRQLVRTYSDRAGYGVARDGVVYGEAIDPVDSGREYVEAWDGEEDEEQTDYPNTAAALSEMGIKVYGQ